MSVNLAKQISQITKNNKRNVTTHMKKQAKLWQKRKKLQKYTIEPIIMITYFISKIKFTSLKITCYFFQKDRISFLIMNQILICYLTSQLYKNIS